MRIRLKCGNCILKKKQKQFFIRPFLISTNTFNDGKEEIVCPLVIVCELIFVRMKNYSFQQSLVRDVIVKFHSRKCKADGTVMAN
ncbi:Vacuolar protein [Trichinella pseudospiralis]